MSVLFCTPCYGGQVLAPHFKSCLDLSRELTEQNVPYDWLIRWNESLVHRARMGMTAEFLKTDFERMMWIDADISFSPDDVARLWNLDADIAVGVYRMKKQDSGYAAWVDGQLVKNLDELPCNPINVDYAGTGFMMIKRHVLEDLSDKVEKYENEVKDIPALYMTPIKDGILLSEDYYFCTLARENGYKITMDTSIKLGHWGLKCYA